MNSARTAKVALPDGTFELTKPNKFSFKHAMEQRVTVYVRTPHKCHLFFPKFVELVSLKVPSGSAWHNCTHTKEVIRLMSGESHEKFTKSFSFFLQ